MIRQLALTAFGAGLLVALVTSPVGVSGAVSMLPVQLDVRRVPSPAVPVGGDYSCRVWPLDQELRRSGGPGGRMGPISQ
jgi:hypothetical protein